MIDARRASAAVKQVQVPDEPAAFADNVFQHSRRRTGHHALQRVCGHRLDHKCVLQLAAILAALETVCQALRRTQ